jgi:adenosylhomocysteine nucleosidase
MVAADKREVMGIVNRIGGFEPLSLHVDFAVRGRWRGGELTIVANGAGPARAAQAVDAAFAGGVPTSIVSTGFCGALDPALANGDIFAATSVLAGSRSYPARLPSRGPAHATGVVLSQDRVAATANEKARLAQSGAGAVEMEAAAVAERAASRDIPFYCIRVVSDEAAESLPFDLNLYRGRDGRFQNARLLGDALGSPFHGLPGLVRLWRNARLASSKLGEFFVNCHL